MEKKNFQSMKFVLLSDEEVEATIRKKRLFCFGILALSILFGLFSTYFFGKTIFSSFYNGNNSKFLESVLDKEANDNFPPKLFTKKIWIPIADRMTDENSPKPRCAGSQDHPFAILPLNTKETSEFYLFSIYDHINMDLILNFERIMHEYDTHHLRLFFKNISKKLGLVKTQEDFIGFLKNFKSEKFKFYIKYIEKYNLSIDMTHFKNLFALTDELHKWYIFLEDLEDFLSRYEQQKRRQEYNLKIIKQNFQEFVTEIQKKLYVTAQTFNCTDKKLIEINKIIKEWTEPPAIQNNNSYVIIQSKILLTSEVNNHLKALKMTAVKTVYIFGGRVVYLDEDLRLPGINVVMVAPSWIFAKKVKITLDGRPGKNHEIKAASEGEPGKPGNPGENAGDFLGFGDFNEKFLLVSSNGGNGGDGQNGGRGRDGVNNTIPGPPLNKPTCLSKIGIFKNSFGQTITHYKIFSEEGCGGSGTDGGVGGFGGRGGKIILLGPSLHILRVGSDGKRGSPGKGGHGGHGGKNGCFYEIVDVDDEILHSVTTIKCPLNTLPSGDSGKDGENRKGQSHPLQKDTISLAHTIQKFFQSTGKKIIEYNDYKTVDFIKLLFRNPSLYDSMDFCKNFEEFDVINKLNRLELYELMKIKIDECLRTSKMENRIELKYLNIIILGKMLILKGNQNYLFVDVNSYLLNIESSVRNIKHGYFRTNSISQLSENGNHKLIKITKNLNGVKSKIETLYSKISTDMKKNMEISSEKGTSEHVDFLLHRRRILRNARIVVDVVIQMLTSHKNQLFGSQNEMEFRDFLASYLSQFDTSQSKLFESLDDLGLSQNAGNFSEHEGRPRVLNLTTDHLICEAQQLDFHKNFSSEIENGKQFLENSLIVAECLSKSKSLSPVGRTLLQDLTDELNHLIEIYQIIHWGELEKLLVESLNNLTEEEFSLKKSELRDVMIALYYSLAVDAVQLNVYPLKVLKRHLASSDDIAEEALQQIKNLRMINDENIICENYHEGVFNKNSSLGEFYFWPYSEIKDKLENLFRGKEITLKANLNNRHLLDKNFIKFKSLKLEFENENPSLNDALKNFQMKITHSGYSYYNWRGETRVLVSSEVALDYGLRTAENGRPEVYNSFFKKFHNGGDIMSPYTTWSVRLLPIRDSADFDKLKHFGKINLRLTGTGTFIS